MNKIKSDFPMFWQCIRGMVICDFFELVVGLICNKWLGLGFWHYANSILGFGQIDIWHSIAWFMLTPLAIWLDDYIRWLFYNISNLSQTIKQKMVHYEWSGTPKIDSFLKMYSLLWIYAQIPFLWRRIDWTTAKYRLI